MSCNLRERAAVRAACGSTLRVLLAALAVLLCVSIFPHSAYAIGPNSYGTVVYGPIKTEWEGEGYTEVAYVATNRFKAAAYLCGYTNAQVSRWESSVYLKLGRSATGGAFYELAQLFSAPSPDDWVPTDLGPTPGFWAWAYSVYGEGNIQYASDVTDTLLRQAKRDVKTVLDGGSVGGSGGGSGEYSYELFANWSPRYGMYADWNYITTKIPGDGVIPDTFYTSRVTKYGEVYGGNGYTEYPMSVNYYFDEIPYPALPEGYTTDNLYVGSVGTNKIDTNIVFMLFDSPLTFRETRYGILDPDTDTVDNYIPFWRYFGTSHLAYRCNVAVNELEDYEDVSDRHVTRFTIAGAGWVSVDETVTIDQTSSNPYILFGVPSEDGGSGGEGGGGGGDDGPSEWEPDPAPEDPTSPSPNVPTVNRPTSPVINKPTDPTPPSDVTVNVVTPVTDILDGINDILQALEEHCVHLQNKMVECAEYIGEYLGQVRDAIIDAINTFADYEGQLHDALMTSLEELFQWLRDNMVFNVEVTDSDNFDDVVEWLKRIYVQDGTGYDNKRPIDITQNYEGYSDWVGGVISYLLPDVADTNLAPVTSAFDALDDKFPFSVPNDILRIYQSLDSQAVTPVIRLTIPSVGGVGSYTYVFDLSPYDSAMQAIRAMEFVAFVVFLLVWARRALTTEAVGVDD